MHPSLAKEMEEIIKKVVAKETTASEMRVVEKKYSKKKFLLADGAFFMALEEDLEIIRVIYYLFKCVSPEQAARHIPEGQESYQTHGRNKGQAHCILSDLWHKKTAEEKLAYQKYTCQTKTVKSVLFCSLNDTDKPTEESGETTDTDNEPQAISFNSIIPASTAENSLLTSGRMLTNVQEMAELWVAKTQVQMYGGSPQGLLWMKLHQERYGVTNCNSELQLFCTGVAVSKLQTPYGKGKKPCINTK
ncbi:hypothetical protein CROQUDRAFT_700585 [Cronartium quercuum f. sp. fusiforme G11]|uniref:Uncharacterized protein n=1 Tax=Cronartium quercuum f. sp. fusiforme G11 TaxID=708437 RepID=A0A9P6NH63_9BASI|nr:hypothetical protein CROQUDRAFT_700585 [Cronartium quercuum f. sp. fusiforme G11]